MMRSQDGNPRAALASLPRIDDLLAAAGDLVHRYGRGPVVAALRTAVDQARQAVLAGRGTTGQEDRGGAVASPEDLVAAAAEDLSSRRAGPPRAVINAAGVVVHTNLGRSPLSSAARQAVEAASGYCDLEYDLATGARGSRGARLEPLLAEACGAEAGIAVNNAAAALVLALAALAGGTPTRRSVLVSRGELVEIGGSFRLPDIMAASGARLVEVGTTNRTRVGDYQVTPDVGMLLRVHPSNYRIVGFSEAPAVRDLGDLAHRTGVPFVFDVGSGLLADRDEPWLAGEPSVRTALADGADLVLCSGDKLLGGPQAGLLVGRADLVAACRRHPLARALRLDKLRIAALVATLEAHLRGTLTELPTWGALHADAGLLESRARALAERLGGVVVDGLTIVGGGSAPGKGVATPVVRVACAAPQAVAAALRAETPPIVVRVTDDAVTVDLRTVPADLDGLVGERLRRTLPVSGG